MTTAQLIAALGLTQHVEGGYFKQTFQSDLPVENRKGEPRKLLTSIYYLLTSESPIGHFHKNQSDIMHYYHLGSPITYYLLDMNGSLTIKTLGPNIQQGDQLQFVVPAGVWKASELPDDGQYGLIGEAVAPGFEYQDMQLADKHELLTAYPQHADVIHRLTR